MSSARPMEYRLHYLVHCMCFDTSLLQAYCTIEISLFCTICTTAYEKFIKKTVDRQMFVTKNVILNHLKLEQATTWRLCTCRRQKVLVDKQDCQLHHTKYKTTWLDLSLIQLWIILNIPASIQAKVTIMAKSQSDQEQKMSNTMKIFFFSSLPQLTSEHKQHACNSSSSFCVLLQFFNIKWSYAGSTLLIKKENHKWHIGVVVEAVE